MSEHQLAELERVRAVRTGRRDAGVPGGEHDRAAAIQQQCQWLARGHPFEVVEKRERRPAVRENGIRSSEDV